MVEPLPHGLGHAVHALLALGPEPAHVLGHGSRHQQLLGLRLGVSGDGERVGHAPVERGGLVLVGRAVVDVGRLPEGRGRMPPLHLHVVDAPLHLLPAAVGKRQRVGQHQARPQRAVAVVYEHGAMVQRARVLGERLLNGSVQKRVPHGHEVGPSRVGHVVLVKGERGVAVRKRPARPGGRAHAQRERHPADAPRAIAVQGQMPAQVLDRSREEALDVVGLQARGVGALDVGPHAPHVLHVERVGGQHVARHDAPQALGVERAVDHGVEVGLPRGRLVLADGFEQQVAERLVVVGHLAQHVEHAPVERGALLLQLVEEPVPHVALARAVGHEVVHVAGVPLADAVDAPEALLDAVGVPRQVVVDEDVRHLQVDALAGGVGGHEHAHLGVLLEVGLHAPPLVAVHATAYGAQPPGRAEVARELALKVLKRVGVLGEHEEFLAMALRVAHLRALKQAQELAPLAVLARV